LKYRGLPSLLDGTKSRPKTQAGLETCDTFVRLFSKSEMRSSLETCLRNLSVLACAAAFVAFPDVFDFAHCLSVMLKRILTIACGVALGLCLVEGAARLASALGILPNRDVRHAASYVRDVMSLVNDNYYDPQKAAAPELARAALRGMVESLDPHSEFMDAKDFASLNEDMGSEFGGIGAQVESRKGRVYVVSTVKDSPGERAGVRGGDEIVSIDGARLDKPDIDSVVEKLRGEPKTKVTVGLFRASEKREFAVTLTREKIKNQSVTNIRVFAGGVGYVRIEQFTERTGEEFFDALRQLADKNAASLIIDLRNNPGGVLESAVDVAEPFFKKGELIVYTQGRAPADREEFRSETDDAPITVPVAVLINQNSASAAEVVAGALKDTSRAVIVGERSFGKGSVQSIYNLNDGDGLRLTTARYYTPGGETIHEHGVAPQVEVVLTPDEDDNIAMQLSRPDLAGDPAAFNERFEAPPLPDRQLQTAISVLQGVTTLDR